MPPPISLWGNAAPLLPQATPLPQIKSQPQQPTPPPISLWNNSSPMLPQAPALPQLKSQSQAAAPAQPSDPFYDMLQLYMTQMNQPQQQQQQNPFAGLSALFHPPERHLGMSGEDITGQKGPYDSGGIDWLHKHNDGTGGQVVVDPAAQAQTQQDMMTAFTPKAPTVQHMLPFTQTLLQQQQQPRPDPKSAAYAPWVHSQFEQLMKARG